MILEKVFCHSIIDIHTGGKCQEEAAYLAGDGSMAYHSVSNASRDILGLKALPFNPSTNLNNKENHEPA